MADVQLSTLGSVIKTAYELEANTNAFTDAEQTKLTGIESLADVTDSVNVAAAGAVMKTEFNAQTILAATADNTPFPITIGESEIVGRASGGNVGNLTAAQVRTIINVESGADVTDEVNVTAALDGATLVDIGTPASVDRILLQDTDAAGELKTVDFSEFHLYGLVFQASDTTGTTDVTTELKSFIESANGALVYIPGGTYRINNLDCNSDVNVQAEEGAVFINDYAPNARCIWQRNDDEGSLQTSVAVIENVRYLFKEQLTRVAIVRDSNQIAASYTKGDIIHIHSNVSLLIDQPDSSPDYRWLGFSAKVMNVVINEDVTYDYIYLDRKHPYVTQGIMTVDTNQSVYITKFGTKKFIWKGGKFKANGVYDDITLGDQTWRRPCFQINGTPYTKIHDVDFEETWHTCITLSGCPFSDISRIRSKRQPNLATQAQSENAISITGITNANPAVVTVTDVNATTAKTILNGNYVRIWGIGGMTELEGNIYRVANVNTTSNTFELQDPDTGVGINSTSYGTWTSGGNVAPTFRITGITNANPAVVTVADGSTLSDGTPIVISGIVGMTELNNRIFKVDNKVGNTFELQDYYGNGDTSLINSTYMGTYSSGGEVSLQDINALGYLVQLYAACCSSVVEGVKSEEGRHAIITSDGISDSTYSATQWHEYGQPSFVTVSNCVSNNAYGIPFDTHEEGINWTFINCVANNPIRGGEGGTYYGCGFQLRSLNNTLIGCAVNGGNWGIRISQSNNRFQSHDLITGCMFRDCQGVSNAEGYGLYIFPEDTAPASWNNINVNNTTFINCGTGVHMQTTGTTVNLGAGVHFIGCEEGIDIAAGATVKATGMLNFDFRNSSFTSPHYSIRMRSSVGVNSTCVLLDGATLLHNSSHSIAALFDGWTPQQLNTTIVQQIDLFKMMRVARQQHY